MRWNELPTEKHKLYAIRSRQEDKRLCLKSVAGHVFSSGGRESITKTIIRIEAVA